MMNWVQIRQVFNSFRNSVVTIDREPSLIEKGRAMTINSSPTLTSHSVGVRDGSQVLRYEIAHPGGLRVALLSYGAAIQELHVPDAAGEAANVVLGFSQIQRYWHKHPHFGTVIGRYANRIGGSAFMLDGQIHRLTPNKETSTAHGGAKPFDAYVWQSEEVDTDNGPGVKFTHISPDGDEGFPGEFTASVTYSLTADNGLQLDYEATTTKPTVHNLTNHSYFNLGGEGSGVIDDHVLQIHATHYTPTGRDQVPTGEIAPVRTTALDFTSPRPVSDALRSGRDSQIRIARGLDHNFVVNRPHGTNDLEKAAEIYDPVSGRSMMVLTTMPGVQVYTSNNLDGSILGYSGTLYRQSDAICFETQQFPDAPNHDEFPSPVLRPDEVFTSTTIYLFGNRAE